MVRRFPTSFSLVLTSNMSKVRAIVPKVDSLWVADLRPIDCQTSLVEFMMYLTKLMTLICPFLSLNGTRMLKYIQLIR